ncbi:MAG: hypothetical protein PHY34_02735 [Patescibacteria group bacterium]|nr:hypothetical protein [Patescibacteria group bacterium]MDD5715442.1 hypothetical protein [Patescibacteria group bacterium]
MSINEKIEKTPTEQRLKYAMLGSLIIVTLVVGVSLASYYYGKRATSELAKSPIPVIDVSTVSKQRVLGAAMYSWQGTVVERNGSALSFKASTKNDDGSPREANLIATINDATELLQWNLTTSAAPSQNTSTKQPISLDDINPGVQVLVQATNDANSDGEVQAERILVLTTPTAP